MVEETSLKQHADSKCVVSFEGSLEDIYRIREFVKEMNEDKSDEGKDNAVECVEYNTIENNSSETDMVNHPSHYMSGIECIDEMIILYGVEETRSFCKLNAHKYRKRAFEKGGKEDIDKSNWYIRKYAELEGSIQAKLMDILAKYDIK